MEELPLDTDGTRLTPDLTTMTPPEMTTVTPLNVTTPTPTPTIEMTLVLPVPRLTPESGMEVPPLYMDGSMTPLAVTTESMPLEVTRLAPLGMSQLMLLKEAMTLTPAET